MISVPLFGWVSALCQNHPTRPLPYPPGWSICFSCAVRAGCPGKAKLHALSSRRPGPSHVSWYSLISVPWFGWVSALCQNHPTRPLPYPPGWSICFSCAVRAGYPEKAGLRALSSRRPGASDVSWNSLNSALWFGWVSALCQNHPTRPLPYAPWWSICFSCAVRAGYPGKAGLRALSSRRPVTSHVSWNSLISVPWFGWVSALCQNYRTRPLL